MFVQLHVCVNFVRPDTKTIFETNCPQDTFDKFFFSESQIKSWFSVFHTKYSLVKWLFTLPGKPPPEITWFKGDEPISASRHDPRVSVTWDAKHDLCVLHVKDARLTDAGLYTLRAANNKAAISASVKVNISALTKDEFTNGISGPDDEEQRKLQGEARVPNAASNDESDLESDASFMTDVTSDMTIDISADEADDVLPTFDDLPIVRSSTKGSSSALREGTGSSDANELEIGVPIGSENSPLTPGSENGAVRKRPTPATLTAPEELPTRSRTPRFEFVPTDQRVVQGEGVRLACKVTGE